MNAKEQLYTQVLGEMKARGAYFSHKAIKAAAHEAGLGLKDSSIKVYLTQAVQQGLIHDAGRGWYSRLSEPVKLDVSACAKLVKAVKKAFPLLEFTVWSTAQLNPWMHHMIAQPVAFLYAPRDTLESVGDALKELGWEVAVNPGRNETGTVRPSEKMVVLRPANSMQPPAQGHQASAEQVLVELPLEATAISLMDASEADGVALHLVSKGLVQIPLLKRFARFKKTKIRWIHAINQRNNF